MDRVAQPAEQEAHVVWRVCGERGGERAADALDKTRGRGSGGHGIPVRSAADALEASTTLLGF